MIVINKVTPELKPHMGRLFEQHDMVDLSIQSIIEGQSGRSIKVIVDELEYPTVAQLFQGNFTVFAGDTESNISKELIQKLPSKCYIMPSPDDWISLAKKVHGDKLSEKKDTHFLQKI